MCKKPRASVGCIIDSCKYACHFPCALVSGGDYVVGTGFYCSQHIFRAKQSTEGFLAFGACFSILSFSSLQTELLSLSKWPSNYHIKYTSQNIWDDVAPKDRLFLQANKDKWEEHVPSFLSQNFESKVWKLLDVVVARLVTYLFHLLC